MYNYEKMSDEQLLRMVVKERKGEKIAESLIQEFRTLPEIIVNSDENELTQIAGIGSKRAELIKVINELARRLYVNNYSRKTKINSPNDAAEIAINNLKFRVKEYLNILVLDTKNQLIAFENVSVGNLNSSIVHPRECFKIAIKRCAASIILAHNHTYSGNPRPSNEDINITKRLIEAGKIIGIEVLDHIIIGYGTNKYFSMKEEGII